MLSFKRKKELIYLSMCVCVCVWIISFTSLFEVYTHESAVLYEKLTELRQLEYDLGPDRTWFNFIKAVQGVFK